LGVVVQVIDNEGIIICPLAGIILVTNIVIEACTEEKRLNPGHASGIVLDSLGNVVVGDSGLRGAGHVEDGRRDRSDRKTCVEIQDADGKKPRLHA
jgi:hypothetical protein